MKPLGFFPNGLAPLEYGKAFYKNTSSRIMCILPHVISWRESVQESFHPERPLSVFLCGCVSGGGPQLLTCTPVLQTAGVPGLLDLCP